MKSYEQALEALKAKYEAQAHAVGDLRTKAIVFRGKTYQEYLEGLNDESNS